MRGPADSTRVERCFSGYDALDRLATLDPPNTGGYPANGAPTEFAYDAAGNRTDFGPKSGGSFVSPHSTYSYDATTQGLLDIKVNGATVESLASYDPNGNPGTWTPQPAGSSARTLKFDALGRLVSITGGFTASYVYDPFGRRIQKTEAGTTTRYQYDGLEVVAEYSATALTATYVFGPGLDEVLKLKRGTVVAAYHSDGLGSVVAISENAIFRNTYTYDAFGKALAQGGSGPLTNAYTYTGRELDASGLYYYRARYYLPSAGRFLTPDPIGLRGGLNAYTYVGSNPVNYTDPFGLISIGKTSFGPAAPMVGGSTISGALSQIGSGFALAAAGFFPYVGDALDIYDVARPSASGFERTVGAISLSVNAVTAGLAPNAGPVLRGAGGVGAGLADLYRAARGLPDSALVARGGANITPGSIIEGTAKHPSGVVGFSAQCNGGTCLSDLGVYIPHNQLGVTTVGDIRRAGGSVVPTSGFGHHVTVTDLSPEDASLLLSPSIPNPVPRNQRR